MNYLLLKLATGASAGYAIATNKRSDTIPNQICRVLGYSALPIVFWTLPVHTLAAGAAIKGGNIVLDRINLFSGPTQEGARGPEDQGARR